MVTYPYESDAKLSVIKKQFTRVAGTAITAGEMGRINSPTGAITIFAGGSTVAKASAQQLTNVNIITSPVVIVQSRGIIDFLYSEKPCTFKNEMWGYVSDGRNDIKFLYYYLKHHVAYFKNAGDGRSSFPQISLSVTEDFPFPLINVDEQQAISDTLSTFDEHIENLTKLIEKKKAIRDGALGDLVKGQTRLDGFEEEWEICKLEMLTKQIITGGTPSTSVDKYWGGTIPWLSSTEIHQKKIVNPTSYITESGLKNSSARMAPPCSVIVALAGQGKTRGTVAVLESKMSLNQSLAAMVANENTDFMFLYYALEDGYEALRELSSGDGGRGGLNKKILRDFEVKVPPCKAEQQAIASILTAMDDEINSLEQERNKIAQLKEGAMNDLLTGRVRLV